MTDPIIIERADLLQLMEEMAEKTADKAVTQTLSHLGIKAKDINPWITQHAAWKLIGRARLNKAMQNGDVEWRKADINRPHSRVYIRRKDLEKLLKNPQL
jgi:hypothetical protein